MELVLPFLKELNIDEVSKHLQDNFPEFYKMITDVLNSNGVTDSNGLKEYINGLDKTSLYYDFAAVSEKYFESVATNPTLADQLNSLIEYINTLSDQLFARRR